MVSRTPNWHTTMAKTYFLILAIVVVASRSIDGIYGIIFGIFALYRFTLDLVNYLSKKYPEKVPDAHGDEPDRRYSIAYEFHKRCRYYIYYSTAIVLLMIDINTWFPAQIIVFSTYFYWSDFRARRVGGNIANRWIAYLWMLTDIIILWSM